MLISLAVLTCILIKVWNERSRFQNKSQIVDQFSMWISRSCRILAKFEVQPEKNLAGYASVDFKTSIRLHFYMK